MPRDVVILGSTGSIGRQALAVLEERPDQLRAVGLAAGSRDDVLADQVARHHPRWVGLADARAGDRLRARLGASGTEVRTGPSAAEGLAGADGVDVVVVGTSGSIGLVPTIAALRAGRTVAIANKEAIVAAGPLLARLAEAHGGRIVPLDSEHAAIARVLETSAGREVSRIWLTASGGPFRESPSFLFEDLSVEQALRHPTWRMGPRTTVLSATLLNKALEIVEARWLFGLPPDRIEVVVHPESIVHALVEFSDGAVLAALGWPDMAGPIRHALCPGAPASRFDPALAGRLTFERPDLSRFPALALGWQAARAGGTMGAVLAAAADEAAGLFLEGRIRFPEIGRRVEHVMNRHQIVTSPDLAAIRDADGWARQEIRACPPS